MKTLTLITALLLSVTSFAQTNDSIYLKLFTYDNSCGEGDGENEKITYFKVSILKDIEDITCEFEKSRIDVKTNKEVTEAFFELDISNIESNSFLAISSFNELDDQELVTISIENKITDHFSNLGVSRGVYSEGLILGQLDKLQSFSHFFEEGKIDSKSIINLSKPYKMETGEYNGEFIRISANCYLE